MCFCALTIWAMSRSDLDVGKRAHLLSSPVHAMISCGTTCHRICAGMHFANQALSAMIATLLWAAEIRGKTHAGDTSTEPDVSSLVDSGVMLCVYYLHGLANQPDSS